MQIHGIYEYYFKYFYKIFFALPLLVTIFVYLILYFLEIIRPYLCIQVNVKSKMDY